MKLKVKFLKWDAGVPVVMLNKETAKEILCKIRAFTPWPGTFFALKDKTIKILEAEISDETLKPGALVVEKKSLKIGTKKGSLLPQKVQLEGKNPIDIASFLNGNRNLF